MGNYFLDFMFAFRGSPSKNRVYPLKKVFVQGQQILYSKGWSHWKWRGKNGRLASPKMYLFTLSFHFEN